MLRFVPTCLAALVAVFPAACGTSPAKPHTLHVATAAAPIPSGEYLATIHTPFVGPIHARLIAEARPDGFKANTPPGVAWSLVGGVERLLGPLILPFLFPSGMLLTWESHWPEGEKPGEGTLGLGSLEAFRANTRIIDGASPIEVRWRDDRLIALVTLEPAAGSPPHADYAALVAKTREILPAAYFDPELAAAKAVRGYLDDLASGAAKANDDAEFLFASAMAARKNIAKYGTPLAYPKPSPESTAMFAGKDQPRPSFKVTQDGDIATLRIDAFLDDAATDEAFTAALAGNPRALILDLRTCPGLELGAARAAGWLSDSHTNLGMYFDATRRAEVLEGKPATPGTAALAHEDGSLSAGATMYANRGLLHASAPPQHHAFLGPVAVLTSRRTSSTAEMLVAALTRSGRAKSFGEATAGRPMLAREFDLGQGWAVRIAAYDFVDADGKPLPKGGLPPSVSIDRAKAPAAAKEHLLRELSKAQPHADAK